MDDSTHLSPRQCDTWPDTLKQTQFHIRQYDWPHSPHPGITSWKGSGMSSFPPYIVSGWHKYAKVELVGVRVLGFFLLDFSSTNVLSYLSSSEVLRLRDISSGNWEGALETSFLSMTFASRSQSSPQVMQHLRIYKSMLSISILGSVPTKISNMMLLEYRLNPIETYELLPRSKKMGALVVLLLVVVLGSPLQPPQLIGVKRSRVENYGQWQWRKACCEKSK